MKYITSSLIKKLVFSGIVLIVLIVISEVVLSALNIFPNGYLQQHQIQVLLGK